jgi:hypothetical protein
LVAYKIPTALPCCSCEWRVVHGWKVYLEFHGIGPFLLHVGAVAPVAVHPEFAVRLLPEVEYGSFASVEGLANRLQMRPDNPPIWL